ncbi:MAG TPA: hypothetical protein VH637_23965 [Streptosporangiaceae bacterium]|jgi:hypothetical protein
MTGDQLPPGGGTAFSQAHRARALPVAQPGHGWSRLLAAAGSHGY